MKKFLTLLISSLIMGLTVKAQVKQASSLTTTKTAKPARTFQHFVGNWVIAGEQDAGGGLEIIDSSTIVIKFMGEEKKLLDYKLDFSRTPFWFDFTTTDTASISTFKSLIEFVNDDMLKWQVFVDEERTKHFTANKGELFYLKRSHSKSSNISLTNTN